MLSACVAALALVACNKEEAGPQVPNRLKTVEISLENFVLTKGEAGEKIKAGDAVIVNDFKIFLTDASGNQYSAKVANGVADAKTYWGAEELVNGLPTDEAVFHYVDPNCTKVIAVANVGKDITFAEFKNLANLKVEDQQNQKSLVLYDEATLTSAGRRHEDKNSNGGTYLADVYEAKLVLSPRVSRFEVDGFVVNFGEEPKYDEIKITQIAFQNYYPETAVATGTETGSLVNHIKDLANQAEVYAWLDTPQDPNPWYRDNFELTITPEDNEADTPKDLAYHMFSCNTAPVMVIKLLADGQPAYLYTKGFFKKDGTPVTEFAEGTIYRMGGAGDAYGDGSIPIDEDDIDPMDRCLEITVEVVDWAVELVYPEF
jgi:hypothetical protein